ncbi:MAG: hypothetical protein D6770_10410 [Anaerolineae bacterium]|nr:MAG: hypothetical protein D6770_10410 [Anaerolineae bacterium]
MARRTVDGVIEAVRYAPDGKIALVRVYERRGPTFSDHILLDRQALLERLKSGQRFVTGRRRPLWGHTFELGKPVRAIQRDGEEFITADGDHARGDDLADTPRF